MLSASYSPNKESIIVSTQKTKSFLSSLCKREGKGTPGGDFAAEAMPPAVNPASSILFLPGVTRLYGSLLTYCAVPLNVTD